MRPSRWERGRPVRNEREARKDHVRQGRWQSGRDVRAHGMKWPHKSELSEAEIQDMRKIIVYIATSADGFIARRDGGVDWLDRPHLKGNYGMGEFYSSIDTILWGRKTYDMLLRFQKEGKDGSDSYGTVKNYAFSRRPPKKVAPGFEFVKESIPEFAKRLRSLAGKDIWMMGGAGIIASFLDEGVIDEFIIHIIPTFIGEGIPLIAPRHRTVALKLVSCRKFSDGVVRLHYEVVRAKTKKPVGPRAPKGK